MINESVTERIKSGHMSTARQFWTIAVWAWPVLFSARAANSRDKYRLGHLVGSEKPALKVNLFVRP